PRPTAERTAAASANRREMDGMNGIVVVRKRCATANLGKIVGRYRDIPMTGPASTRTLRPAEPPIDRSVKCARIRAHDSDDGNRRPARATESGAQEPRHGLQRG